MVTRIYCATMRECLDGIDTLEELEGFTDAIRNPAIKTLQPTDAEWREIAEMKIRFQRQGGRR